MSEEKNTQIDPVKKCEEMYPEMTKEFKKILKDNYELFCRKQLDLETSASASVPHRNRFSEICASENQEKKSLYKTFHTQDFLQGNGELIIARSWSKQLGR